MNEMDVWGQDSDLSDLEDLDGSQEALVSFSAEVLASDNAEDVCGPLWNLLWSARRILWRDLILLGRISVGFTHSHVSGYGTGPITLIRTKQGENSTLCFSTSDFENSDSMHMEYGSDPGLFGWPEYCLSYVSLVENDESDLYEHSFDAEARVEVVPDQLATSWSDLDAESQKQVVQAILAGHAIQIEEFEELIVAGVDVLAMVALHPGTSPEALSKAESAAESTFVAGLGLR